MSEHDEDQPLPAWVITGLREDDHDRWCELYRGYGDFYEVPMPGIKLELVWSWILDPDHELSAMVVRPGADAAPVGLAHFRPFARPLHGSVGCYLDDLFVDPAARGQGAVDALLAGLQHQASRQGWDVVRWITRTGNVKARSAYDRLAWQTDLVTYDLAPAD